MTYRIHTADADEVHVQVGTDMQIEDALGGYASTESDSRKRLVLNDMNNQEALVLVGSGEALRRLAQRITEQVDLVDRSQL